MSSPKHPLRELVKFLKMKPQALIGWNPDTCTVLENDLEIAISQRLNISVEVVKSIWFGIIADLPQELLVALEKEQMSTPKVLQAYKEWRNEYVIKPIQERKAKAEMKKQERLEKESMAEEKKKSDFLSEWS